MSWFKRKTEDDDTATAPCVHGVLVARWEQLDDIGIEARASGYTCEACGAAFTPWEARRLREDELARHARA